MNHPTTTEKVKKLTSHHDHVIDDAYSFVRLGEPLHGSIALQKLQRLMTDLPDQQLIKSLPQSESQQGSGQDSLDQTSVFWTLSPVSVEFNRYLVDLTIKANPVLICQRCMKPFVHFVEHNVRLELTRREKDLVSHDEAGYVETAEYDMILARPILDVLQLVEDELILSLPYIPKHDVCPDSVETVEAETQESHKESPFAVLRTLKN